MGRGTNRVAGITRVLGVDLTRLGSAAENPFEAWLGTCLGDCADRGGSRMVAVARVGRDRTGLAGTREQWWTSTRKKAREPDGEAPGIRPRRHTKSRA